LIDSKKDHSGDHTNQQENCFCFFVPFGTYHIWLQDAAVRARNTVNGALKAIHAWLVR
jgi:hypothetical protein